MGPYVFYLSLALCVLDGLINAVPLRPEALGKILGSHHISTYDAEALLTRNKEHFLNWRNV